VPALAIIEEIVFRTTARKAAGSTPANQRIVPPFSEPLELPAGCRGIEVHYTAPSFVSPEKVKFQINLPGQDLNWHDVGGRRVAYFDELQAGQHVFQVRAANDDGLWSQTGASLTLTVLPFFWQTGLFRGLVLAGVCAGALFWAYRLKAKFESKRAAHEAFTRQLILYQENERKRVASELHDGLGQDLMLIKNRLGMLTAGTTPEIARQLQEISATTSRTIAEVRSISHALRPSALEQVGLTKALEWMVEQLAEVPSSKFSIELENIDGLLTPEMEINLYRIVQEALNNVLKHANASEVIIGVKREAEGVSVSVFDNGQGFEIAATASNGPRQDGFGLISMAERAKVLGGQLDVRSTPGIGTRLTLHVNLAKRTKRKG
jgi:signal transduction histidine kinase